MMTLLARLAAGDGAWLGDRDGPPRDRGGGGGGRGRGGDGYRGQGRGGFREVWGKPEDVAPPPPPPAVVVQPVMELSGKLAAETNKVG